MRYLIKRLLASARFFIGWRGLIVAIAVVTAWGVGGEFWPAVIITIPIVVLLGVVGSRIATMHDRLETVIRDGVSMSPTQTNASGLDLDQSPQPPLSVRRSQAAEALARAALALVREPTESPDSLGDGEELRPDRGHDPLVTVVVPCFNDGRFLGDCLDSLLQQSFPRWRCVVVDDASTDDSVQTASRYAASDQRITLVRHYRNSGLPAARNTGLVTADTPYVTFLDADDVLLADSLLDRIEALAALDEPRVAGVYCGVRQHPEDIDMASLPSRIDWKPAPFHDFLSTRGECPFNAHAPMLHTSVVKAAGGFDESLLNGAEDWDLWLRIMRNGYHFRPSRWIGAIYRQKQSSMVRSMPAEHLEAARRLIQSAHEPMDANTVFEPGAPLFDRPLAEYDQAVTWARRVLSFAGLASLADPGQLDRALDQLPDLHPDLLDRHLEGHRAVGEGVRRGLGVDRETAHQLRGDIDRVTRGVLQEVAKRTAQPKMSVEGRQRRHDDVVFAPQTGAQARRMVGIARQLSVSSQFVVTDRIDTDSGAIEILDALGVPWSSATAFSLRRSRTRAVVIEHPYGQAIAELVGRAKASQLLCLELENTQDRLDCVELEAVPSRTDPDSAVKLLCESDAQAGDVVLPPASLAPTLYTAEEYPNTKVDSERLESMRNRHAGESCVIIGNGPSLNKLDLRMLAGVSTFAVNGIFYAQDKMGFDPTYYVVEDSSVMKENVSAIREYRAGHKLFPSIYRNLAGEGENITYFMMNRGFYEPSSPHFCVPRFSTNAAQRVFSGQSVTIINLQLAYHLGFRNVALIGMDFSYVIPESADQRGDIITSNEDDPNHFHPEYFGKGKTWKDPKLDRVLANYALAKDIFEGDGRRIVNATPGGKLELFDRVEYENWLRTA